VSRARFDKFAQFESDYKQLMDWCEATSMSQSVWLKLLPALPIDRQASDHKSVSQLLAIEGITLGMFSKFVLNSESSGFIRDLVVGGTKLAERVETSCRYKRVEAVQRAEIEEVRRAEAIAVPSDFDYGVLTMSPEAREKLARSRPVSIGAAARIPGITPAAVYILMKHFKSSKQSSSHHQASQAPTNV
jgi:tRNA U34 5-carboxymethylaminomethyl modifying enzyme MnmG/GidA